MGDRQADAARRHVPTRSGEELLFNRTLGENVRERRRSSGLTQDQVAAQAGMTRGSIANIERGEQTPGLYRLLLICGALGCEIADVLPNDVLTPEAVASAVDADFSSALHKVRRAAARQRRSAARQ